MRRQNTYSLSKVKMQKQAFFFSAIVIIILGSFSPTAALALSNPYVIEKYNEELYRLEYTVVNPSDSITGDIVGFIIEVDFDYYLRVQNDNGWQDKAIGRWNLPADNWNSNMLGDNSLTWSEFFGGMDYPFADSPAAAYFVNYQEVSPNTFEFDWEFHSPPYHLPILPGESRDSFYAYVDGPASQFLLAYINDAENGTFDDTGLPSFQGEAVPEPSTLFLLSFGAMLIRRKR